MQADRRALVRAPRQPRRAVSFLRFSRTGRTGEIQPAVRNSTGTPQLLEKHHARIERRFRVEAERTQALDQEEMAEVIFPHGSRPRLRVGSIRREADRRALTRAPRQPCRAPKMPRFSRTERTGETQLAARTSMGISRCSTT